MGLQGRENGLGERDHQGLNRGLERGLSRRQILRFGAAGAALTMLSPLSAAAMTGGLSLEEQDLFTGHLSDFIATNNVRGLSIAMARHGELVFEHAVGSADEFGTPLTPRHRMRVASLSKPITGTTVMALVADGRVNLEDRVFGPDGLLPQFTEFADPRALDITVSHLLHHTAGGWSTRGQDPTWMLPELSMHDMMVEVFRTVPLDQAPGTGYAYSNMGYLLLGRVIEAVTGRPYEDHVRERILLPAGADGLHVGGGPGLRGPDEVTYATGAARDPATIDIRRRDAGGGWVGRPRDLVAFLLHMDGRPSPSDLLPPDWRDRVLQPTPASGSYGCGWNTDARGASGHSGFLPGTGSVMLNTPYDISWAVLVNSNGGPGGTINERLRALPWTMVQDAGWI